MSLRAIVVNENTIDFVSQSFPGKSGVPPKCLKKRTFFVYSDDFRDNFRNKLMAPEKFNERFSWRDAFGNDNVVLEK